MSRDLETSPNYGSTATNEEGVTTSATENEDVWELNKVLETIGVGPAQYIFWTISFLIAYSDYAELTLIAIIIPYLRCEWNLTKEFEATITISIFLIYAASALLCGKLSDIYGRRRVMSITTFVLIVAAVGAAGAYNRYVFLFCRCIAGACIGANFATVVVYSTEFSPNKYRTVGPFISLLGSYISMFAVNLLGYFFLNSLGWRKLILIITIPVIPAFFLLILMPESPRYLCVSGQSTQAVEAVHKMARLNKAVLPENLVVYCHQGAELGSFKTVLGSEEYRKPALLLSIMYFANIFVETGILVFLPLAFISHFCGEHAEAPSRLRCTSLSQDHLSQLSVCAVGSLVGCVSAYFVAIKFGRLIPLRISNVMQIFCFALIFKCVVNLYLSGIACVIKIINAFICVIIWLIVPESFPTKIRNTTTGMINSSGKIGAVAGTSMVYLLFYVSPFAVICCFIALSVISCICSFILDKDTSDAILVET